ncbi:MAG: phosphatidylinositol-specific phospholipase C domain-containing protein [Clostridia bacterium]
MKKTFFRFLALALACALCMTFFVACSPSQDNVEKDIFFSKWQADIKDDALLKNIVIAGSHDAGTVTMTSMACTQSSDIKSQLKAGARYFDLRVAKSGDEYKMFHGPIKGVAFEPIANDIKSFLVEFPTETLILDFQHFENSKEGTLAIIEKVGLDKLAIKNTSTLSELDFVDALTLGQCRGKALILWGDRENGDYFGRDYLFRRNNDGGSLVGAALDSYYDSGLQKLKSAEFISQALPNYYNRFANKNKGLFVLQGQLTSPYLGSLKELEDGHSANMSAFVNSLATDKDKLAVTNIIMRDFVTDGRKVEEIISLNLAKGLVKESSIGQFQSKTKLA